MKKTLLPILFGLLINTSANAAWIPGTKIFFKWSTHEELISFYADYKLDELCNYWKENQGASKFTRKKNIKAIKHALSLQGHDKFICKKIVKP